MAGEEVTTRERHQRSVDARDGSSQIECRGIGRCGSRSRSALLQAAGASETDCGARGRKRSRRLWSFASWRPPRMGGRSWPARREAVRLDGGRSARGRVGLRSQAANGAHSASERSAGAAPPKLVATTPCGREGPCPVRTRPARALIPGSYATCSSLSLPREHDWSLGYK